LPKSKNQIIGTCIFRNEDDGCLSLKNQHGDSQDSQFIEGCILIGKLILDNPFIGTYSSIWLVGNNNTVEARLINSKTLITQTFLATLARARPTYFNNI
jgi:hypothetical protein